MKTGRRIIHAIAQCQDCDWMDDDYVVAARKATEHAKRNPSHTVLVEQGTSYKVKF